MIFWELFVSYLKIGFFGFGGGYAMLPLIQADVQAKGWMTAKELVNFIAVSESTPGPFAVNVSTYVGAELAGLPQIQGDILDNVSRYVKPGGVLLYSTCTLLQAENEDVVTAFLAQHPEITVIRCENTAVAARMVAESGRSDVAALSSRACMDLYGLENLAASVQDQGNNFTRFICIAKDLEIYPGADRTSLMVVLPHRPGSLYQVLSRFYALGVNLNKLESRPIPERNFEFMFYFDLETSVYAPQFTQLMGELPELCEDFSYLGSYSEVI